jgi:CPA1 family monovalent cation:H+ antiporter
MLAAERNEVLKIRHSGTVDSDVLTSVMDTLDVEESMIDRRSGRAAAVGDRTLVTPARTAGQCDDLVNAPVETVPLTPDGCPDCLREGLKWVHLRLCLQCGNVGCCDSSVGNHATKHFERTRHPVMRSFEPGEAWRWCYLHELLA